MIYNMQTFLFFNPASGRFARRRVTEVVTRLNSAGLAPTLFSVTTPAEALPYCRMINQSAENPLVIVAAGDGTVNAVVNGLLPATTTLAVLPLGTSNVLAAEIGIRSIRDGIERIARGKTRPLSVGLLELEQASHRFVLMAGIGLDGAVVREVRPLEKRLLHQGAFALSALRNCLTWDRDTFEVVTPTGISRCHSAVVCNASRYGGNFVLAAGEDPCSPGFTIVCMSGRQRRDYLRLAWDLFRGKLDANSGLLGIPALSLEIRGRKPIQIDGDFVGYGPAKLTAEADFARLIV